MIGLYCPCCFHDDSTGLEHQVIVLALKDEQAKIMFCRSVIPIGGWCEAVIDPARVVGTIIWVPQNKLELWKKDKDAQGLTWIFAHGEPFSCESSLLSIERQLAGSTVYHLVVVFKQLLPETSFFIDVTVDVANDSIVISNSSQQASLARIEGGICQFIFTEMSVDDKIGEVIHFGLAGAIQIDDPLLGCGPLKMDNLTILPWIGLSDEPEGERDLLSFTIQEAKQY